ncbi:hypothetical protein Mtc_0326 [Methanocella conradii HZ254]|uniref:Uncharacterized protein n=1 Tax=Methanocella conradii (strain DSM 24694 / JCM 17849 / CGMCC 1.5162 / HZ254) TaxID=1041930 RepID=H8IA31_METCZ|nr:DUF4013 domain-containing protein [Methanocella conradii]AFC99097.1 hypothetical protein Mtc_0326 [Methanocella conradii HZ254]MDI6896658.1 DUF4013 domain-containing protein [Methanocella conradii]
MPRNDDLLETFIGSLKYASSSISALLIGGIVFFLAMFLVGLPFFLGYITKCMREAIDGNGVLPEWGDIAGMLRDGVRMLVVFMAYALAYLVIVSLTTIPLFVFQKLGMPYMAFLSTIALLLTMAVVAGAFSIIFFASWVLYATSGSVSAALSPQKIRRLISLNPAGYLTALLASLAIMAAASASALLVIVIPWVAFTASTAISFIYSKYYQSAMKMAGGVA